MLIKGRERPLALQLVLTRTKYFGEDLVERGPGVQDAIRQGQRLQWGKRIRKRRNQYILYYRQR
jgi:hypothetical protein